MPLSPLSTICAERSSNALSDSVNSHAIVMAYHPGSTLGVEPLEWVPSGAATLAMEKPPSAGTGKVESVQLVRSGAGGDSGSGDDPQAVTASAIAVVAVTAVNVRLVMPATLNAVKLTVGDPFKGNASGSPDVSPYLVVMGVPEC